MDTHDVLVRARNILDREGWGTGGPDSRSKGLCLGHALALADGASDHSGVVHRIHCPSAEGSPAFRGAVKAALAATGFDGALWLWNDFHCEGPDHAIEVLNEAIAATAPEPYVHLEVPQEVTV